MVRFLSKDLNCWSEQFPREDQGQLIVSVDLLIYGNKIFDDRIVIFCSLEVSDELIAQV